MSKAAKKYLGLALEIGVTAALLFWLLRDPHKRAGMAAAFLHVDWRWLAAGLAVYGCVESLAVIRWKTLLYIQGFRIDWPLATGILFIGEFFLTCTPGLVGGDVARTYYLIRNQPEKKVDAVTAVLMDRIMGMIALILMAVAVLGARHSWLSRSPVAAGLVKAVAVILGVGAAALIGSVAVARAGVLDRPGMPGFLRDMGRAFEQFSRDWPRTSGAFATTVISHVCYYTSFCCAARALAGVGTAAAGFWDVFSVMPIENTLTAMPISFAGIGLRESLFQSLLHDLCGVDPAVGALVGSLGFGMKALWSLPGAAIFVAYGWKGRKPEETAGPAHGQAEPSPR